MAGQFLVTRGGRQSFYDQEQLRALASRGQLERGDLVYHPVLGRWLYAREVEEVRGELEDALKLGRPGELAIKPSSSGEALTGFILGTLGYLPVIGLLCCLGGIYFSAIGLKHAREIGMSNGLAVAGMVLSIVFLIPATACAAVFLSVLSP